MNLISLFAVVLLDKKMKTDSDYRIIDTILNLFYNNFPMGINFFVLTYGLNIKQDQLEYHFEYLTREELIEDWRYECDKQIITEKGIDLIKSANGIENYMKGLNNKK